MLFNLLLLKSTKRKKKQFSNLLSVMLNKGVKCALEYK